MASVKVTFNGTTRRFSVPKSVNWSTLTNRLRDSFSLPPATPITLLYTDEDGDVITLSTDMELKDIMNERAHEENPTLKFVFTISPEDSVVAFDDLASVTTIDTVSTEEPQPQQQQQQQQSNPEEAPSSHASFMNLPTFLPTISSDVKGKHKSIASLFEEESVIEPIAPPTNSNISPDVNVENTINTMNTMDSNLQSEFNALQLTEQPFLILADKFQSLLDQFRNLLDKNPQLFDMANNVMEKIRQNITVDLEMWKQRLASFDTSAPPSPPPKEYYMQTPASGSQTNIQGSSEPQSREYKRPSSQFLQRLQNIQRQGENNLVREQQREEIQRSTASSPDIQQQSQDHIEYTSDEETVENVQQSQLFPDAQIYEFVDNNVDNDINRDEFMAQLLVLHEMGFHDDEASINLLTLYEGDVNQTIEMLLQ